MIILFEKRKKNLLKIKKYRIYEIAP
jgi:hypothetical protein